MHVAACLFVYCVCEGAFVEMVGDAKCMDDSIASWLWCPGQANGVTGKAASLVGLEPLLRNWQAVSQAASDLGT